MCPLALSHGPAPDTFSRRPSSSVLALRSSCSRPSHPVHALFGFRVSFQVKPWSVPVFFFTHTSLALLDETLRFYLGCAPGWGSTAREKRSRARGDPKPKHRAKFHCKRRPGSRLGDAPRSTRAGQPSVKAANGQACSSMPTTA